MWTPSRAVRLLLALAGGALAVAAALGSGAGTAGAATSATTSPCLLIILCPPTSVAQTTTTPPPVTTPPPTFRSTTTIAPRRTTTTAFRNNGQPTVGISGLPTGPINLPPVGSAAPVAPQLAGSATPAATDPVALVPTTFGSPDVVAAAGVVDNHATARSVLAALALVVAAVALAQLPAARRALRGPQRR